MSNFEEHRPIEFDDLRVILNRDPKSVKRKKKLKWHLFLDAEIIRGVTLFRVHFTTCVLHFAGAITGVVLIFTGHDWSVPVVTSRSDWRQIDTTRGGCCCDEITGANNCYITPIFEQHGFRISLTTLVVIFHFLSFFWQFLVLIDCSHVHTRKLYEEELKNQRNILRWGEYSLSAPLMTIVLAVIFGVIDAWLLFSLAACTSALQAFGYGQEIFSALSADKTSKFIRLLPLATGCLFFTCYWSAIVAAFVESIVDRDGKMSPPPEMYAAIWTSFILMTILFSSFAVVLIYDVSRRDKVRSCALKTHYLRVETVYALLSVTSKWALGGLLIWIISIRKKTIQLDFRLEPAAPLEL